MCGGDMRPNRSQEFVFAGPDKRGAEGAEIERRGEG